MHTLKRPGAAGLYDPTFEHDACGVGAVADLSNRRTHETIGKALWVLDHLEHRGASGSELDTGDGAGILLQTPDELLREVVGFELPDGGRYGVGVCFLPREDDHRREVEGIIEQTIEEGGQRMLGWRDVPVDHDVPGPSSAAVEPFIRQVFVESTLGEKHSELAFERRLYVIRRVIESRAGDRIAIPSFSSRTLVYKGMLTSPQLPRYYPDLRDERIRTALALVHSRFSTNTFPSWELAHPYRMICHNGEINTLRGNVNWMRARESQLLSDEFGDDLEKLLPVAREGWSDSAIFDSVLEILVLGGRSLPHSLMMMIPEAWENHTAMAPEVRDLYAYHSCPMEPWAGPAAIGSMGNDFALAVLSEKSPPLYSYFKQLFAQVTNPAIDPIRERVVMSLETAVGPQSNLFTETPEHAHQLIIGQPILSNGELEKLRQVDHHIFQSETLDATWPVAEGADGLARAMERLCREASECLEKGDNILILSDRAAGRDRVPIPALLAVSGVHHHLVREGTRLQAGLVVESGEPREVHHMCCLLGYGASAINPYLAIETLHDLFDHGRLKGVESAAEADANFVKSMGKGILKTISKMGISTVRRYSGA